MLFYEQNELGKYQSGTTAESSGDADNAFSDTIIVPYLSGTTNLVLFPYDMTNVAWTKTRVTVPSITESDPDEGTQGNKVLETAVLGSHLIENQNFSITAESNHTITLYLKAFGRTKGSIEVRTNIGAIEVIVFDLGVPSVNHGTILTLTDGWFKIDYDFTTQTGATTYTYEIQFFDNLGVANYLGDITKGFIFYEPYVTGSPAITLERKLEFEETIDSIFVLDTNIDDFTIYAASTSGGSYVDITSNATLQMSEDGLNRYYKFDTPFSFYDMKFECLETNPAGQEKRIGAILGFLEIGEILRFSSVEPVKEFIRKTSILDAGGIVTMNKGSYWTYKIKTQYVGVQSEVDVANEIQNLSTDFFFWLNGGYEGDELVRVEPYRFEDLIKCVVTGKPKPSFHKNYLNKVVSDNIGFKQTGAVD